MTEIEYTLNELINGNKVGKKPRAYIKIVDRNNRNESLVEKLKKQIEKEDKENKTEDQRLYGSRERERTLVELLGGLYK